MKYLLMALLLFCSSVQADNEILSDVLFCSLLAADRVQTGKISASSRYEEANPLLTKSPSIRVMNTYFSSACVGFIAANKYLPEKIYFYKRYYISKKWLSRFTIGAQMSAVSYNISVGIPL